MSSRTRASKQAAAATAAAASSNAASDPVSADTSSAQQRVAPQRSRSFIDLKMSRAFTCVFAGCALNNITLELLVKSDRGIGNTITVCQFIFIALVGLTSRVEWRGKSIALKPTQTPLSFFAKTATVFVVVSLINNAVFIFNISLPFHMLFRSCSLVVSMSIGLFALNKKYPPRQIASCLLITLGVLMATMADSMVQQGGCCDGASPLPAWKRAFTGLVPWLTGVALLLVSLVLSAGLGHAQEWGYKRYGRNAEESLFYSHVFALPFFMLLAPDLFTRIPLLIAQPPAFFVPWTTIPISYVTILLCNVVSQYVCIRGVYDITCFSSTLTCTFALTIRKFFSLLISVLWMGNTFTPYHWVGTVLVFSGTVVYSLTPASPRPHQS